MKIQTQVWLEPDEKRQLEIAAAIRGIPFKDYASEVLAHHSEVLRKKRNIQSTVNPKK